jgi:hypothetical protein
MCMFAKKLFSSSYWLALIICTWEFTIPQESYKSYQRRDSLIFESHCTHQSCPLITVIIDGLKSSVKRYALLPVWQGKAAPASMLLAQCRSLNRLSFCPVSFGQQKGRRLHSKFQLRGIGRLGVFHWPQRPRRATKGRCHVCFYVVCIVRVTSTVLALETSDSTHDKNPLHKSWSVSLNPSNDRPLMERRSLRMSNVQKRSEGQWSRRPCCKWRLQC